MRLIYLLFLLGSPSWLAASAALPAYLSTAPETAFQIPAPPAEARAEKPRFLQKRVAKKIRRHWNKNAADRDRPLSFWLSTAGFLLGVASASFFFWGITWWWILLAPIGLSVSIGGLVSALKSKNKKAVVLAILGITLNLAVEVVWSYLVLRFFFGIF